MATYHRGVSTVVLPDTVTGAIETGVGVTLIFVALTSADRPMSVMVAGLGLAITAGMCHSYQARRQMSRSAGRSLLLAGAALAALAVLALALGVDLSGAGPLLLTPVVLAAIEVGLRWLAERSPAPTPWHLVGWLVTAATALVPLAATGRTVLLVAGLVCAAVLLLMGAVDNHRLTSSAGPTPERPAEPPNPVVEWVRGHLPRRN